LQLLRFPCFESLQIYIFSAAYLYCMGYRKFKADFIFNGTSLLASNNILITDEKGIVENIVDATQAGDDIESFSGIISPGFINCHCHLELSHMKGLIEERTGLVDFVLKVVTQRHFAEEEILDAINTAENEMLQNGIVALGDICNNTLTIAQKKEQRLAYYNFIETSGWLEEVAQTRFDRSFSYYKDFQNINNNTALVPHAPYSVSEKLWELLQPFFKNKTVTIHNQETAFEDELFLQASGDFMRMYQLMKIENSNFKASGKSSLQTYFHKLKNAANVLLVHNTFSKQQDIAYAKETAQENKQQLWWCVCPNANLYIENALPDVAMFTANNCNMVIGTDSLASNHSLNILEEIKTLQKNFPSINMQQLLQWATLNGGLALNMQDVLGSFEKGKKPGVVLIDNIRQNKLTALSKATRIV
jgi:cytosine/adenosine deaminase-related metal-dependent hydrolase